MDGSLETQKPLEVMGMLMTCGSKIKVCTLPNFFKLHN